MFSAWNVPTQTMNNLKCTLYSELKRNKRCLEEPFGVLPFATPVSSRNPLKRGGSTQVLEEPYRFPEELLHCVEPLWLHPGSNFYLFIIISCCYYGYH